VVRIAAASVRPVTLRFARPLRTAQGEFTERRSVLLELRDAEGRAGFGEAAPWPGFGTESVHEATDRLRGIAARMERADPPSLEHETEQLAPAPAARAALVGALCDLEARAAAQPLAQYLASRVHAPCGSPLRSVAVHALLTSQDPVTLRDEAACARAAGFRALKLKLGAGPLAADVERARAARDGAGEAVALRGDANGAWDECTASAALEALAPFGFEYVEQPLPAGDLAGFAALRGRSPLRIAADESVANAEEAKRLIDSGAVDVVVLKPAMLGGPLRALEIAGLARDAGLQVVFSHAFESVVGALHALHCAAAWGEADAVHGLSTAGLFVQDLSEPANCANGVATVGAGPGIGVTP
jgi:o-succinylbenzoate synthase